MEINQELLKKAELGDAETQFSLGEIYYYGRYHNGFAVPKDYKKAAEWFTKAANQGNACAYIALMKMSPQGLVELENDEEIKLELLKKAEAGDAKAQFRLGEMYYYDQSVLQDYNKVIEWFTKSANQGNIDAQFALGDIYHHGLGVAQDYKKAAEWFTKAANQGNTHAYITLKKMSEQGLIEFEDDEEIELEDYEYEEGDIPF